MENGTSVEVIESASEVAVVAPPPEVKLTKKEELFALAMIEHAGNPKLAYAMIDEDAAFPGAKGNALLNRPHVQARIQRLMEAVSEQTFISKGTHMVELAHIRDLAKAQGNVKVALQAERTRGEVVGFYAQAGPAAVAAVSINFVSKHDHNI